MENDGSRGSDSKRAFELGGKRRVRKVTKVGEKTRAGSKEVKILEVDNITLEVTSEVPDSGIYVSPTEPPILHTLGIVSLLPENHGVDILDMISGTGVQRKTLPDLYASINDGRLSKQIGQRQQSLNVINAVLLLEGASFKLDIPMSENQIQLALLSIQRSGYYFIQTRNLSHTRELLPKIFHHFRQLEHGLINRPPNIISDWRLTMLQLLPGVGTVKAKRILDGVGFPFMLKDIEEVRKIVGPATFAKIEKYLGK